MNDKTENHGLEQAKAQLESVREMVAALEVDYDRLEELRESRAPWCAGWNMAGYMPDSEPATFEDFEDAKQYIIDELKRLEDEAGEEGAEEKAENYCSLAEDVNLESGAFSVTFAGYAFWVSEAENNGLSPEEFAELRELESAAGECAEREEAEQRIREDALSVEARSGWHTPGMPDQDEEFRIVLCTGGPHVEIRGELDNGQPDRPRLMYQDWGTSLTEYITDSDEAADLLTYCEQFFFGE